MKYIEKDIVPETSDFLFVFLRDEILSESWIKMYKSSNYKIDINFFIL